MCWLFHAADGRSSSTNVGQLCLEMASKSLLAAELRFKIETAEGHKVSACISGSGCVNT